MVCIKRLPMCYFQSSQPRFRQKTLCILFLLPSLETQYFADKHELATSSCNFSLPLGPIGSVVSVLH